MKSVSIERLHLVVEQLHKCGCTHRETVPVHVALAGKAFWHGEVAVFELSGHPKAVRCYAWSQRGGPGDKDERFFTVLGISPVVSARIAVQAALAGESRTKPE